MPETPTPATDPVDASAAAAPASWDELFKDQDPSKVKEALDNARKWEARSKENHAWRQANESKVLQFNALEQASKTDAQRLEEAANQARQEAESARTDALRYRIAVKHGLADEDIDLLGSGTEDELMARAERIAAKNAAAGQQTGPRAPAPNPAQGSKPGGASDPRDQFASFLQGQLGP